MAAIHYQSQRSPASRQYYPSLEQEMESRTPNPQTDGQVRIPPLVLWVVGPASLFFLVFQAIIAVRGIGDENVQESIQRMLNSTSRDEGDELGQRRFPVKNIRRSPSALLEELQMALNGAHPEAIPQESALINSLEDVVDSLAMQGAGKRTDELSANQEETAGWSCNVTSRHRSRRSPWKVHPIGPVPEVQPFKPVALRNAMAIEYLYKEKLLPYVGHPKWKVEFPVTSTPVSRKALNSLAVFPFAEDNYKMHGLLGIYPNGSEWWDPLPEQPLLAEHPDGKDAVLKRGGGFYLELSESLPLSRIIPDNRCEKCKSHYTSSGFDIRNLDTMSIVVVFYNEPLSTLLRTVHSVLNYTPPPLLTEIILVDDHSDRGEILPGGKLDEAVALLPKVKVMRLPERRGLVRARLAGAQVAMAPTMVILDSHIEVSPFWSEPLLARLAEEPQTIVFPVIYSLSSENLTHGTASGIGCFVSWFWNMIERSTMDVPKDITPVASPGMAGGLFAVNLDWFWKFGGYDENFYMWGSENVEMPFRVWMCGGRVEGIPCSLTYHIFRHGGVGYASPPEAALSNKLRTARLWMDEYYQTAKLFIFGSNKEPEKKFLTNLDQVLELKEKLKCKNFKWFLENVDPEHNLWKEGSIEILGEVRNYEERHFCLDTLSKYEEGQPLGRFMCHGMGGSQWFFKDRSAGDIGLVANERRAVEPCSKGNSTICQGVEGHHNGNWSVEKVDLPMDLPKGVNGTYTVGRLKRKDGTCLEMSGQTILVQPCKSEAKNQLWYLQQVERDPNFDLPKMTADYRKIIVGWKA